jgi:N-acyl-D-aspartate/D-glutamate deacylase
MSHDVLIRGGRIIDGTGAPGQGADVAISNGRIAAIGTNLGGAVTTIDAGGALVTPGFVDIHTHYDGQASWDEGMMPSSVHGATTVVMGSCGVGFAPCRPDDRDKLVALMEGVEDIPGSALSEGLRWNWERFDEYLAALDAQPHAIDLGAMIPHDAVRVYVMGERALAGEVATEDDARAMGALVREAIDRGASGFSTGRTDNHRSRDGRTTPAADATAMELRAIASALSGSPRGVLQAVSDFDMNTAHTRFDPEFDLLEDLARISGRPLSISLLQRLGASEQWKRIVTRVEQANEKGITVRTQVATRGIGVLLGLTATFHPFLGFPSYRAIAHLPLEERVRAMRTPEVRARMLSEKSEKIAGDGSAVPPLADQLLGNLDFVAMSLFRLGEHPDYEPSRMASIFGEAMRAGKPVLEVIYDALLGDEGHELLYFPIYNYGSGTLAEVREMLRHPQAMLGLGDGGAHVGTICDASMSSYFLSHWVRDEGLFTIEQAIAKLTSEPAAWMGYADRGRLEVGMRADVNVIDLAGLSLERPRLVHDLPAGGRRFLQRANGYRATLVRGEIVAQDGNLGSARPGRIVRPS